jgi:CheY-like chemotaxis protein
MAAHISEVPAHQPRALIVDDSQIARYILSCELERLGYEVEVAESAEAALAQLAKPLPDVIFMDHLLPGIDGLEAVSRLRGQSATAKLPIIMYTSQDGEDFAERAQAIGADDIYVKSADETRLTGILGRLSLLPDRAAATSKTDNVTPLRRAAKSGKQRSPITREQLARLLEPSLEAHHAKLRQELLGEFAILERYEEGMRRDLFARVEALSRQTNQRLDRASRLEQAQRRRRTRRLGLIAASFAASMLLISALGVRLAWDTVTRTNSLQDVTASTLEVAQANTVTLAALQQILDEQKVTAATAASTGDNMQGDFIANMGTPNAAAALVNEFQSLGILGPIRVETAAGAFCVSATAGAPVLVSAYGPLQSCEQLPMQMTARND